MPKQTPDSCHEYSRLYFNAGLLVIDVKAWREKAIEPHTRQLLAEKYDLLETLDQDALNVILQDDWIPLDYIWNQSQYLKTTNTTDGIIHLIGPSKPWHADYNYTFKEPFYAILDRTAYHGKRPLDPLGMGAFFCRMQRTIPTTEIVLSKIRRMIKSYPSYYSGPKRPSKIPFTSSVNFSFSPGSMCPTFSLSSRTERSVSSLTPFV